MTDTKFQDLSTGEQIAAAIIVVLVALLIGTLAIAVASLIVWIDVDWIAGHDLSFREAVGFGALASFLSGGLAAKS